MLWGHSWLIDKIRNISWHVILQVCPRYKIVVVVGHNGVKSLMSMARVLFNLIPVNDYSHWMFSFNER